MGFEGVGDSNVFGLKMTQRHKRSKSFPDKNRLQGDRLSSSLEASQPIKLDNGHSLDTTTTNKTQSPTTAAQNSLKQEILNLEKRLENHFGVRHALENALGYTTSSNCDKYDVSMPRPTTELIKEIAVLEFEVVHLEQYLLSLYRKAFDQQVSSIPPTSKNESLKSPKDTPSARCTNILPTIINSEEKSAAIHSGCFSFDNPLKESSGIRMEEKHLESAVLRCQSSLSHHPPFSGRINPPDELSDKAVRVCHSQPLSMMEYAQNAPSSIISLAEHLGTCVSDHILESPNKLSEDMIKCMSAIFCKLAEPLSANHGNVSPASSISSTSAFSPHNQFEMWSPGCRNNSSFDLRLDNPFHVEGLKDFSGPYSTMVEVSWIHRDNQKVGDVEIMLQNFKSLISQLEEVDLKKLRHEEKLAFWVNVHNALVMHAFLAYGIPQNNIKRLFLLLKAAYNVGGHTVSADTIQNTILGCRMSRPGQWLRLLLPSRKFKSGDDRQSYTISDPEPLLHFALCSGSHSDPAVRVYTPKRVFQELESAKEEYIRATFGTHKDQKILLPKLVESFAKDAGLCSAGVLEMVQECLPHSLKRTIKKCQRAKSRKTKTKTIEWIPYNFSFRYLISKEILR